MTGGARTPFRIFGMEFAPLWLPLERRLQTLAVFLYMSLFLFLSLTTVTVSTVLILFTPLAWVALLYVAWYFYDLDTGEHGGRRLKYQWFRRCIIFDYFRDYFPIKLVKTADLDPNKTYLMGSHPHGILSFGAFGVFASDALGFHKMYPGVKSRLLTLKQQFWLPGSRELVLATGTCSATKNSMERLLSTPKGLAVVLVVGGASEALNYDHEKISLVLNKRKGFVKLAIRFGVSLVPTFSFGEAFIYHQLPNPEGSRLRRFQDWFESKFAFSPPLFFGRGVFQYSFGYVPYRKPITVVVGAPIPVDRMDEPSNDDVERVHAQYTKALVDLYEKYNPIYGDPKVRLEVA